ncbi:serine hydrolase FSH [Aspergillus avenaceus]|uniref:Serine hydrolase FSH n=1 Tax=Aspergillus avenaceus TaxID=36643 RepID=A0A5N6U615_ASPAV|nr:serine hydrolase FSH [Aspergillus avenaceus]
MATTVVPLPAILCLHGAGTNSSIFQLQARRIVATLQSSFRFIFIDAPFGSPPGPGVHPAFTDLGPFYRWHCDSNVIDEFDITLEDVERERWQVRDLIASHIKSERATGGPGIVGVMAFSQGTRVATGLCLDKELSRGIEFAILIGGTFPSLELTASTPSHDDGYESGGMIWFEYDAYDKGLESLYRSPSSSSSSLTGSSSSPTPSTAPSSADGNEWNIYPVNIPSIHVQGTADPWRSEGDRLRETYYNPDLTTVLKFRGRHQVPTGTPEANIIAESVISTYEASM